MTMWCGREPARPSRATRSEATSADQSRTWGPPPDVLEIVMVAPQRAHKGGSRPGVMWESSRDDCNEEWGRTLAPIFMCAEAAVRERPCGKQNGAALLVCAVGDCRRASGAGRSLSSGAG